MAFVDRLGVALLVGSIGLLVHRPAHGADALIEAKRRAASELMHDGKTGEAVSLINEVLKGDKTNYRDYLLLARAYDKLNKQAEAVDSYRHVLDLLANSAGNAEERQAKTEAEKRLKVLDAQVAKIQAVEDEFLKKLDALEREAISARDVSAVRRVFRLKAGIYKAGGRRDRTGVEVQSALAWQDAEFVLKAGKNYRIRAVGTFQVNPDLESSADGTTTMSANTVAPLGMLLGQVEGKTDYIKLGSSARLTPDHSGRFLLLLNSTQAEKARSSGSVTVLIEQE